MAVSLHLGVRLIGLGTFRFLLACLVVIAHLTGPAPGTGHLGTSAVFAFYVVSGFLITRVLNDVYAFRGSAFWANRWLRLFPAYYLVTGLTLPLILLFPDEAARYHRAWIFANEAMDYVNHVTLVPLAINHGPLRIVPPSWSVAVEVINYGVLWAFTARSVRNALFILALGAAYHLIALIYGLDFYYAFYAALLPFACGALVHFVAPCVSRYGIASVFLLGLHLVLTPIVTQEPRLILYVSMALSIVVVASVSRATPGRTDKFLGDLSYPIFLTHWLVGFCIVLVSGTSPGWTLLALSIAPLVGLSWALAVGIDLVIEPMRRSNRLRATSRFCLRSGISENSDKEGRHPA